MVRRGSLALRLVVHLRACSISQSQSWIPMPHSTSFPFRHSSTVLVLGPFGQLGSPVACWRCGWKVISWKSVLCGDLPRRSVCAHLSTGPFLQVEISGKAPASGRFEVLPAGQGVMRDGVRPELHPWGYRPVVWQSRCVCECCARITSRRAARHATQHVHPLGPSYACLNFHNIFTL